ncbi:hypothetical protein GOP47_0003236 [Adiantum capillus-veneris]|uniref:Uncharacterized protein n=1 Tax=Adiantum capillus-veneris TaxID=13818 RepID=A0A9D4VDC6_ADICA|nr:hypothetical protein GOP47_0003236 [Adiantum capillus-veneris]
MLKLWDLEVAVNVAAALPFDVGITQQVLATYQVDKGIIVVNGRTLDLTPSELAHVFRILDAQKSTIAIADEVIRFLKEDE